MISSLLHFVGLRPRVYYTLTNFRGGGGKAWPSPPPQYANAILLCESTFIQLYISGLSSVSCLLACRIMISKVKVINYSTHYHCHIVFKFKQFSHVSFCGGSDFGTLKMMWNYSYYFISIS